MKNRKAFLALLLIFAGTCTMAQTPLQPRNPRLFYQWWYEEYLSHDSVTLDLWDDLLHSDTHVIDQTVYTTYEKAYYFHSDSLLNIVGIAVDLGVPYNHRKESSEADLFRQLRLYEIDSDSLTLLREIQIASGTYSDQFTLDDNFTILHYADNNYLQRYDYVYYPNVGEDTCVLIHSSIASRLYEFYFEEPITVRDSFYLSYCDDWLAEGEIWNLSEGGLRLGAHGFSRICYQNNPQRVEFPTFRYKYRIANVHHERFDQWYDKEDNLFPLIFPILQYAECKTVNGLQRRPKTDDDIIFEWDSTDRMNRGWEFTYVPEGQLPETGTIIPCTEPHVQITIDSAIPYRAYVRQMCIGDQYSDWGDGVPFQLGQNSLEFPSANATSITPNPTTGLVTINNPYGLLRVEVYDMVGGRLLDYPCHDEEVKIDLSHFAAGSYLLKATTSEGTTTQTIIKN